MDINIDCININPDKCCVVLKGKNRQCKNTAKYTHDGKGYCGVHYKAFAKIQNPEEIPQPIKKKIRINVKKQSQRSRLFKRLEKYMEHIDEIVKVQKLVRGFIVKNNIKYRGISCYARHLVNNDTDFLTFDEISSIPVKNYYSYKDNGGFTWGFDIATFKELINNPDVDCTNPYNTQKIDDSAVGVFRKLLLNIEKIHKVEIEKAVINDPFIKMQQKCINVFQKMDKLEQYTQCEWFTDLNVLQLKELYKQMLDLWDYRINLSDSEKRKYVTSGKLFTENVSFINKCNDKNKLCDILLDNFDKLVTEGKTRSDRTTGALWILSGLTLVSNGARDALPWLFQSANVY